MKLKKGDILLQSHLKDKCELIRELTLKHECHPMYILKIDGFKYLVMRTGGCNPKICNSACCKITATKIQKWYDGTSSLSYLKGFYSKRVGEHMIKEKNVCKRLCKNGKCRIWKRKNFPDECKEFPHPTDGVYVSCMKKCSFKFEIYEVIQ